MKGLQLAHLAALLFFGNILLSQEKDKNGSATIYHSIQEALKEPDKVEYLEIKNLNDADSLLLLQKFPLLKSLSLIDYHGTEAPEPIAALTGLKEIRFINDDFNQIPTSYANLTSLERVWFIYDTHLNFESALNFANALPKLVELRIEGLPFLNPPAETPFPTQLEVLSLRNNHLTQLPQGISAIKNLRVLDIGNNELSELPNYLSALPQLTTIYLDRQPFLQFETTFSLLKESKTLAEVYMQGNHLDPLTVRQYAGEPLFKVLLDQEEMQSVLLYTPDINMNLPKVTGPMYTPQTASYKIPINRK